MRTGTGVGSGSGAGDRDEMKSGAEMKCGARVVAGTRARLRSGAAGKKCALIDWISFEIKGLCCS